MVGKADIHALLPLLLNATNGEILFYSIKTGKMEHGKKKKTIFVMKNV